MFAIRKNILLKILFLFAALTVYNTAFAQLLPEITGKEEEKKEEAVSDSLGRDTPRGTVNGYIQAMADQKYIRASRYLNLKKSYRSNWQRERIAKALSSLLDHGGNIMPNSWLSNKPGGRPDDELAANTDLVGTITANGEVINLYVENVSSEPAAPVWQFSTETVNAVAAVKISDELLVDRVLPQTFKDRLLGGVPVGHWLAVVVIIVGAYLLAWGIIYIIGLIIPRFWYKEQKDKVTGVINALSLPFRLYLAVWLFVAASQEVGISIIIRQRFSAITVTVGLIAFLILLWRLTDFISTYSNDRMSRKGRISAISVILFVRRTIKVAIFIFGFIAILGAVGVDITTYVAALGIGGIALALGAQKTVENFVGSVTLVADQPIRVGDFCKIGDISGTVEQIGMRSTKLRTGERTIVTIPNGEFSSSKIENYAHRDRYLFNPIVEVRYETTPDQIRYLLVELRKILYAHPKVNPDPARVRFTGFGESSLKIEIYCYIDAESFDDNLEVKEDLLLRIMDVVAASGSDFAFPSQTLYFGKDNGLSEEKSKAATDTFNKWIEDNDVQLPYFTPEKIEELKGSITYPRKDSASGKNKK